MATPQESITMVNGRRCTRSRARFVITSTVISETAVVTPTELTTSTAAEEAPQIPTSIFSSPSEAPSSSSVVEQPVITPTTEAVVSSTLAIPPSSSTVPPAVPTASSVEAPISTLPELPNQSATPSEPSSTNTPVVELPQQTKSVVLGLPTGGQTGVAAPEQSSGGNNGIGSTDIETIVGGTVGGAVGLALLGILLFFCLRKRRSREQNWDEKRQENSSFTTAFIAKIKGDKARPTDYQYERHVHHPSVSSVYSTPPHGRSSSELGGVYGAQGIVSINRTSSKKSEVNLVGKKPAVVSSQYRFSSVAEGSVGRNSNGDQNPFADPEPPANIQLFNSDSNQPLAPPPAATAAHRSPFASLLSEIEGAPNWLRESAWSNHKRAKSSLNSHPPSPVYQTGNDPFMHPLDMPPLPNQTLPPNQARGPSNAYSGYPAMNAKDTPNSRDSDFEFFGEPGPSRPATRAFTPAHSRSGTSTFTLGRPARQSDPFDLDRPEVLGFRSVISRMVSVRK